MEGSKNPTQEQEQIRPKYSLKEIDGMTLVLDQDNKVVINPETGLALSSIPVEEAPLSPVLETVTEQPRKPRVKSIQLTFEEGVEASEINGLFKDVKNNSPSSMPAVQTPVTIPIPTHTPVTPPAATPSVSHARVLSPFEAWKAKKQAELDGEDDESRRREYEERVKRDKELSEIVARNAARNAALNGLEEQTDTDTGNSISMSREPGVRTQPIPLPDNLVDDTDSRPNKKTKMRVPRTLKRLAIVALVLSGPYVHSHEVGAEFAEQGGVLWEAHPVTAAKHYAEDTAFSYLQFIPGVGLVPGTK